MQTTAALIVYSIKPAAVAQPHVKEATGLKSPPRKNQMLLSVSTITAGCLALSYKLSDLYDLKHLPEPVLSHLVMNDPGLGPKGRTIMLYAAQALPHSKESKLDFSASVVAFCSAASNKGITPSTPLPENQLKERNV